MERFVKINKQVKNNLYKICRLCGIDNPNKVGILEEVVFLSDDGEIEPPLYKKIFNCVGIQVTPNDQMPKTICALCFDKINDFHEFREMCYVTNVQTRKLLGLSEQPKLELKWEQGETVVNSAIPKKDSLENKKAKTEKKAKKRKNAEPPPFLNEPKQVKLENEDPFNSEVKIEDDILSNKASKKFKAKLDKAAKTEVNKIPIPKPKIEKKNKLENTLKLKQDKLKADKTLKNIKQEPRMIICQICQMTFASAALLQSHLLKLHVPSIDRYFCVRCNEKIEETNEIKSHNLWHKLSKTPYQCGRCDKEINSLQGLTRHIRECHLVPRGVQINILPNVICKLCSVEFQTKNLFFMHGCITSSLQCPKCKCKLSNQSNTLKHIATCNAKIRNEEEMNYVIKDEPLDICPLLPPPLPLADSPVPLAILPSPSISKSKASKNSIQQTGQITAAPIFKENRNSRISHTMVVIPSSTAVQTSNSEVKDSQTMSTVMCTDSNLLKPNGKKQKEEAMMARCSVLLQDTFRTLVNIKQEPMEAQNIQTPQERQHSEAIDCEIQIGNFPTPHIKQEVLDENYKEVESNVEINIKQEIITYPTISQPPLPALKLKIKKEHGTLNSSFIANMGNDSSILESQKKKKIKTSKKKNKETEKLTSEDEMKSPSNEEHESLSNSEKTSPTKDKEKFDFPQPVVIKSEQIDPEFVDNEVFNGSDDFHNFDDYNSEEETELSIESTNNGLPIIADVQSVSDSLQVSQQSSSALLQISSISSGTEALDKIQVKETSNNQFNTESEAFGQIQINRESENLNQVKIQESINSTVQEKDNSISLMPQIVAVSSGIKLPSKNTLEINIEDKLTQENIAKPLNTDIPMLQISEVSSGVNLDKNSQENDIGYANVVIKEEPDFGDYLEQAQEILSNNGKIEESDELNDNNEGTVEESSDEFEDDSNEYEENEDNFENSVNENLVQQDSLVDKPIKDFKPNKKYNNTKRKLKKQKSANSKSLQQNLKESNLELESLNFKANESQYSNNIPLEEGDKLIGTTNPVVETESLFDPNIKIKQEIEFTEETFVEDDQYEYGSDNDQDNYDEDYNCNEFGRYSKSPSPIKELQPIIMNMGMNCESSKLNLINFTDLNNEKNEALDVSANNTAEINKNSEEHPEFNQNDIDNNSKESLESENFGFKKIKLNMFPTGDLQTPLIDNIKKNSESDLYKQEQSTMKPHLSHETQLHQIDLPIQDIHKTNPVSYPINLESSSVVESSHIANTNENILLSDEVNEQFSIRLPKLENINEIAENHNNENFEKMLRNEIVDSENCCTVEDNQCDTNLVGITLATNTNPPGELDHVNATANEEMNSDNIEVQIRKREGEL
ncbi:tanabin [Condylostylus longicornis]|uniref:tanabin n=1 Tax=Condylostylus longicornis TaxID=2530218 RepID=UPI00244E2CE5|nr:tanabin [Condylostylus longicornis]